MLLIFPQIFASSGGGGVPTDPGASSKTDLPALPVILHGAFRGYRPVPVLVDYQTPNGTLLLRQPTGMRSVYVSGLTLSANVAATVKLLSNSTEIFRLDHQNALEPFVPDAPWVLARTKPGESLILQADAALPPFTVYLLEK